MDYTEVNKIMNMLNIAIDRHAVRQGECDHLDRLQNELVKCMLRTDGLGEPDSEYQDRSFYAPLDELRG